MPLSAALRWDYCSAVKMLDSLLEQLLLTIHCLESDNSLPQATENDILHLTLKHSEKQLPTAADTLKQHVLLILNSLFPQDQQRAQLNIKRGTYGIRSLISYLNTIRSHPACEDQLLEPHLNRILKLLIGQSLSLSLHTSDQYIPLFIYVHIQQTDVPVLKQRISSKNPSR